MKSIITLASAAMLTCHATAQPIINSSHVAPNFNAELYFTEVPEGFSVGQAGANRTWNFSSLDSGMLLGTQSAIPVTGSPYASEFPQANYCYTMESVFADDLTYFYYNLTQSKFEIYSLGYGGEVGEAFINPRTYVVFPYTFNTVFTDTFQRTTDPAPVSVTATYDAYGTLIMPFGTFSNVVRQKTVQDGLTNYTWFNVNPFYPILQTSLEDGILGFVMDNTVLGIGDQGQMQTLVTYPNPARNTLYIKIPDGLSTVANISITDLSGKTLMTQQFNAASPAINIEKLSRGIYIVTLTGDNNAFVGKIVKS